MLCQYVPPTTPPNIPGVPRPGGGIRPGAGLLQEYYNNKIHAIGEDAKKKVANMSVQRLVMIEINSQNPPRATGTFVITQANTFAQGVGRRPGAGQGGCGRDEECFGARLAGGNRYPTTSSSRIPTSPA